MGFSGITSVVRIAVKKDGKILLIRSCGKAKDSWRIPYRKFNSKINGNLKSTVGRILEEDYGKQDDMLESLYYIGSSIQKRGTNVSVVYDLVMNCTSGSPTMTGRKWTNLDSAMRMNIDDATRNFMEMHLDYLK